MRSKKAGKKTQIHISAFVWNLLFILLWKSWSTLKTHKYRTTQTNDFLPITIYNIVSVNSSLNVHTSIISHYKDECFHLITILSLQRTESCKFHSMQHISMCNVLYVAPNCPAWSYIWTNGNDNKSSRWPITLQIFHDGPSLTYGLHFGQPCSDSMSLLRT